MSDKFNIEEALLLDVNYLDLEEMDVSMDKKPTEGDNMALKAQDDPALQGLANDDWPSKDMQELFDASQLMGMVGQPSPGSSNSGKVDGQLEVPPPQQEEVVELDSG